MQIIVFRLNDLYFGLSTEIVEEITERITSTPVPKSPTWIDGLVNLRGDVLTLVNTHNLLEINDINEEQCYNNTIVIQLSENNIALMVDEIVGVTDIDPEELQPASDSEAFYIESLLTVYDKVVSILDINSLFEEKEE